MLRSHGVDMVAVIGGYHSRGIIPLRRRALRLYEMTPDKAPFEGTVTADPLPSVDEVWRRVGQAVRNSSVVWPPSQLLPMLLDEGTKAVVSSFPLFDSVGLFLGF